MATMSDLYKAAKAELSAWLALSPDKQALTVLSPLAQQIFNRNRQALNRSLQAAMPQGDRYSYEGGDASGQIAARGPSSGSDPLGGLKSADLIPGLAGTMTKKVLFAPNQCQFTVRQFTLSAGDLRLALNYNPERKFLGFRTITAIAGIFHVRFVEAAEDSGIVNAFPDGFPLATGNPWYIEFVRMVPINGVMLHVPGNTAGTSTIAIIEG